MLKTATERQIHASKKSPSFPDSKGLNREDNGLELMEDNGLEQAASSPCLSDIDPEAAQNPAQLVGDDAVELLRLWTAMDDAGRADVLAVARGLASHC